MDNPQETAKLTEKAWLAGILDGEGWVGFSLSKDERSKTRRTIIVKTEIKINNTDKAIIDKCIAIFKKLGVNPYIRNMKVKKIRKRVYEVSTKNMTGVPKILRATLPYLTGNKHQRAKYMLEFIKLRKRSGMIEIPPKLYTGTGPRKLVAPYTDREVELVEKCKQLQNPGSSETTSGIKDKAVKDFKIRNQQYKELLML